MQDSEYYRKDLAFIISEEIAKTMSTLTSEIKPIKSERRSMCSNHFKHVNSNSGKKVGLVSRPTIQTLKLVKKNKPTKRPIFSLNTIKTSCMFVEAKIDGALISFLVDIRSAVSILEEDFLTCFIER